MNQTALTPEIIAQHGLSADEYARVLTILGREPNLVELGIFSVMWSEHCSYKSSRRYLKNFPTQAPHVIQGPGENAGVIDIGDGEAIAFKMESHNHPSYIEPYQGAATGVGGILRDVFTMGARPIANLDSLRFGEPSHPKTAFLVGGVVAGIAGYGNCMGIPTVGGDVYFDACYNGNNLVNAMTVGLVARDRIFYGKAAGVGNPVIYVGSKTGRDGIHGATMASDSFDDAAEQKRPTVQVGDPFVEKLLLEACLELMAENVIVGIQDMGAAGLTSSSFEMASRAETGIEMDLDQIPQREAGMSAYEMMLSESQERMLMVVERGREDEVFAIFQKWDLDVAVVGKVTDTKRMVVKHQGEVVVDLPIAPLAAAAPVYDRPCAKPSWLDEITRTPEIPAPRDYAEVALQLTSSPTLASKKWVYRQYDHMVRTATIMGPGSDAALVRIGESKKAVSLTSNCNSRYVYLNPRVGAAIAVAESARNIVCTGAVPLALTDCLNFGNPERPEIMWQFAEACQGISAACEAFAIPVVSGNVSFYNETSGVSIFPTPMIGMVGLIKDVDRRVPSAFQSVGDIVILLGETRGEWGGSEYLKMVTGRICGTCPELDFAREKKLWDVLWGLSHEGWLCSAHDVSEGGLWQCLLECCEPLGAGFKIEINSALRADAFLFSESQSRALISVTKKNVPDVLEFLKKSGLPFLFLGDVRADGLVVRYNGTETIASAQDTFFAAFRQGFERALFPSGNI